MSQTFNTYLVTGGAGFVGSSIALYLKAKRPKDRVLAFDNLKRRGSELNLNRLKSVGVEFVHGDVRDVSDLEQVGPVDWLIECSAEPSVQAGYNANPAYVTNTNLNGAIHCLEHLRRHGGRMIFLSTSRVYPIAALRDLPLQTQQTDRFDLPKMQQGQGYSEHGINEHFTLHGSRSLYGTTKLCAEHYIAEYGAMYGIETVINRCGILSGPWQMGKVDQGVITLWMARHLFGGSLQYTGFGGTGQQVRDALHVQDLCELVHTQMESIAEHAGATYNVGGGLANSVSLRQLTDFCQEISSRKLEIGSESSTHPADIPYYVSDASRVMAKVKWEPRATIETLLHDIHHWLVANRNMLEPLLAQKGNA